MRRVNCLEENRRSNARKYTMTQTAVREESDGGAGAEIGLEEAAKDFVGT